jgi:hypothetical protein
MDDGKEKSSGLKDCRTNLTCSAGGLLGGIGKAKSSGLKDCWAEFTAIDGVKSSAAIDRDSIEDDKVCSLAPLVNLGFKDALSGGGGGS